ncbi:MAG: glycosyltransferase family 9 protein [Rhodocyclaceae bacterium]
MIGDFRERIFARLIGSKDHRHIGWAPGHPFASIIRNPLGPGRPICVVPTEAANVYRAYQQYVDALTGGPRHVAATAQMASIKHASHIGLHPFASQACKQWPDESWQSLAAELQSRGVRLTAYGAPTERERLELIFGGLAQPIEFVTRPVVEFAQHVASLDLLVGLDSFSVHVAERAGVPSIMLNAANHPSLWVPPGGRSVSSSGGCSHYPCLNSPKCEGRALEYACIRSLKTEQVLSVLNFLPKR